MIGLTNTSAQYVSWTSFSNIQNLSERTILIWMKLDSLVTSRGIVSLGNSATIDANEFYEVGMSSVANKLYFGSGWSTTGGLWRTTSDVSTGENHVAITYSNSSTANNPSIYINNSLQTLTKVATPAGSYRSGTTGQFRIGGAWTVASSINGGVRSVAIYNRILSADEIAEAYVSRLAAPNVRGLRFNPILFGCAGGADDGDTMTSSNVVVDIVTGEKGTPSGSPVFYADTYLNWR